MSPRHRSPAPRRSRDDDAPAANAGSRRKSPPPPLSSVPSKAPSPPVQHPARDDGVHEHSPLLSPADSEAGLIGDEPQGDDDDEARLMATKSPWYLLALTITIGGLQMAWSVEFSNGTPYLLSLGLTKSLMALVWIAGPLSGTLVQPYIGILSDNCRLPWGRRKPFLLGGTAATVVALVLLSWTREIVGGTLSLFGADIESKGAKNTIITFAVIGVYLLDFAINTVQASIRAFIVDCAPPHQQETANAMASQWTGIGNILGYIAGYINLPVIVGFLGATQFKDLCAIASFGLVATVLLSCVIVKERNPSVYGLPKKDSAGVLSFFRQIFASMRRLPPQTKQVCKAQFFAWVGFFPMLFYTSSYIGEIYVEPFLEENPHMTPDELDQLYEHATRVGTFALLIWSLTSLFTNLFLPFFIAPSFDGQHVPLPSGEHGAEPAHVESRDYDTSKTAAWLNKLVVPGLTLRRAWMYAQILFTVSMLCTVLVRHVETATVLIGLVGITWALTLWAPWAIISAEVSRRDAAIRARKHVRAAVAPGEGPATMLRGSGAANDDGYSDDSGDHMSADGANDDEADHAGVILGIHNMAIAAPQVLATVGSSVIFRFFQKPRGVPGDHSIAIVMALGGLTLLISAYFIHTIDESGDSARNVLAAVALAEEGDAQDFPAAPRTPRASLERAALVRNSSFGGAEY